MHQRDSAIPRAAMDRPKGAPKYSVFWSNQWVQFTPSSPIKTAAQGGVFIWRWRQSSANPSLRQIPCLQGKIQGISAFSDSVFSPHSSETPAQCGSPAAKAPSLRNQNREFNFPDQGMNREFFKRNREFMCRGCDGLQKGKFCGENGSRSNLHGAYPEYLRALNHRVV